MPNSKTPVIFINRDTMAGYGIGSAAQVIGKWIKIEQRGSVPPETEHMDIRIEHVAGPATLKERNNTCVYVDDIRIAAMPSTDEKANEKK